MCPLSHLSTTRSRGESPGPPVRITPRPEGHPRASTGDTYVETGDDRAPVLLATLSKRYVDPTVLEREFDIVLIDEVSMATAALALPALGGARRAAVLIGDPHQLPPIVQWEATKVKKWLGVDLFDLCGQVAARR